MAIKFPKDLVIVDFEFSHRDLEKAKPLQIGALRLDSKTLAEKDSFVSYIYQDLSDALPACLQKNGINPEKLAGAPSEAEVAMKFVEQFGKDFIFCSWVAEADRALFRKLMISAGINPSEFDYHVYDLWPVVYTYLLGRGYEGSMRSDEMFEAFGLSERGEHDALEDCRYAASVLGQIAGMSV